MSVVNDDQPLMTIGMFARATLLSVRSLRAYHERGLLVPAAVDPDSGYRAYHPGQIPDAVALRRLRELDVPLQVIKEMLDSRDPEITTKLLAEHQTEMQARLAETERIVAGLQQAVTGLDQSLPVHVRKIGHQHALAIAGHVEMADYASFLGDAYERLWNAFTAGGYVPAGPAGARYEGEVGDGPEPVTAFIPIGEPIPAGTKPAGIDVIELPAMSAAVAVHDGSYDRIGDTYASLGAWVAYHAEAIEQPVRELYVVGYGQTDDVDQFRTEIHWPIRPRQEENPR